MNRSLVTVGIVIVLLVGAIYFFFNIFVYLVISLIIAAVLAPVVDRLDDIQVYKVRLPRWLAVIISFLLMLSILSAFVSIFIPLISDQLSLLRSIDEVSFEHTLADYIKKIENILLEIGLVNESSGFLEEWIDNFAQNVFQKINFSKLLNEAVSFTGSLLISIIAILFMSFFILLEKGIVRKFILQMIPNQYFELSVAAFYKIRHLLVSYLSGLLFQMVAIFSLASVLLTILGVNYALTVAALAAVANLIPYVGPIVGTVFGILVGLTTGDFGGDMHEYAIFLLKVSSAFAVVQLTDNVFLQPMIFSKSVKAHPLEIFVIIFVGANLAGALGMIAAIPVYTILRVISVEVYRGYTEYHVFQRKYNSK